MKWPRHVCGAPRVVSSVCGWGGGILYGTGTGAVQANGL